MNAIERLTAAADKFRAERDWKQFHNPKDMALSLVLESTEVLELTQWHNGEALTERLREKRDELADELSDVLYWVLMLAHDHSIDLEQAFIDKLAKTALKYPIEKAKGKAAKYTELE